mgnify:CR=1 FL=1
MNITNRKLVENITLMRQISQKQLPVKVSYTLSRNISHINSAISLYDKERKKLLDKYAKKDEKGKFVLRSDGRSVEFTSITAAKAFQKDLNTLLDIKADIDIRKIKLSDFGEVSFSAAELTVIDYMIEN